MAFGIMAANLFLVEFPDDGMIEEGYRGKRIPVIATFVPEPFRSVRANGESCQLPDNARTYAIEFMIFSRFKTLLYQR